MTRYGLTSLQVQFQILCEKPAVEPFLHLVMIRTLDSESRAIEARSKGLGSIQEYCAVKLRNN
jgi:hypothetical protein